MADFVRNLLGGQNAPKSAVEDADFADFASARSPQPPSHAANPVAASLSASSVPTTGSFAPRPYTKWYRVWERTSIADFYNELFIIPFILLIMFIHWWGTNKNKQKAKTWIKSHLPVLESEFAVVGFDMKRKSPGVAAGSSDVSSLGTGPGASDLMSFFKVKASNEYITYATGRQNVAFIDFTLNLHKRYNPLGRIGEEAIGFFMESVPPPKERLEAISYAFDGNEKAIAPLLSLKEGPNGPVPVEKTETFKSTFDGFVFAIVHKDSMKQLRLDRYDLSLTVTKEHQKLPDWAVVMSESSEVTEAILGSKELIDAVKTAGEDLEALIVTDMPLDSPKTLNDLVPRKRIVLLTSLPDYENEHLIPIFRAFIRLPDILAAMGRFRPEAMRRIRATREEVTRKIKKIDEDEKAEERKSKAEKDKKEDRDKKLSKLSAEEQRKFLEKERATEMRRSQKRQTLKA